MIRDEPTIRPNLYRLPRDPVAAHILVPAFKQASSVRGAFGWFSAGWISRLSPGLAAYLRRDDVSPIEFTIAPALFPAEYDAVREAALTPHQALTRVVDIMREAKSPGADALATHAVDCLAWMVANGRLILRVAIVRPGSNYHPKVWLFSDSIDTVAVRGSANATGRAIFDAVEHMDVDCTWDNPARVAVAEGMVEDWARGRDDAIQEVLDLPRAFRDAIVRLAPADMPTEQAFVAAVDHSRAKPPSRASLPGEIEGPFHIPADVHWRDGPYSHQGAAVTAWESGGRRGVVAMATGAGKTITALIAAYRAWQEHNGPFLLVVSAPSTPLVAQWNDECQRFGLRPIVPTEAGGVSQKNQVIGNALLRLRLGRPGQIEALVVTNNLLASTGFQNALRDAKVRVRNLKCMHIGDEAHSLGSPSFIQAPPDFFDLRLGLSATPERQYDDEGTTQLFRYFGNTVFEFGLAQAIGFCLVPYDYHVHIAHLDGDELNEFQSLTARIGQMIARAGGAVDFGDEALTALFVQRRAVVETASSKISVLRSILAAQRGQIRHTLVYTSSKNPDQLLSAKAVVADLGLVARQVTEAETGNRKELQAILDGFGAGDYEVLLAKRVLDEGVDIPQTRQAILLASSSVQREWVQRRGRVLRKFPGKTHAVIHDVIALPPPRSTSLYEDSVLQFISSELDRVRAFSRHARNKQSILHTIDEVHEHYFLK
jgi:superfamily II DNA or RNA helicase